MKIPYSKKTIRFGLIFSIVLIFFGMLGSLVKDKPYWTDFGLIIISVVYLIYTYLIHKYKYLTIENNYLKINSFLNRKVHLQEVTHIKYFAGGYTLFTPNKKLSINTQLIHKDYVHVLEKELEKLSVEKV